MSQDIGDEIRKICRSGHVEAVGGRHSCVALALTPHALAPVAELPVLEVVSAVHILADLTLGLGKVVHDYLRLPTRELVRVREKSLAI
jgi:acetoacetate decarboxylase